MLVGAVQSLFEGAMYIFVLQWPPSLIAVVQGGAVPFGKVGFNLLLHLRLPLPPSAFFSSWSMRAVAILYPLVF